MRFASYDPQHLAGMCACYNLQAAGEPHIAPLTPELFAQLAEAKTYFDPSGLIIACEGGDVVGWVHACMGPASEPWQDGSVRFPRLTMLVCPAERPEVGVALVREGTAWLAERAGGDVEAMHCAHGYPFYRGLWMGGEPMNPTSLPHLHLALGSAGYRTDVESVFMAGQLPSPPEVVASALELTFEEGPAEPAHAAMRESWVGFAPMRLRALHRGVRIGEIGWVLLPHVAPKLGAPCVGIWSLGVNKENRGKWVASALVSRALAEAYHLGARFGSVGTQVWNFPAQRTYAKFGFRPHSLMIGRKLSPELRSDQ